MQHRWVGWDPITENFDHFSKYKRVAPAHPSHDFYEIFRDSVVLHVNCFVVKKQHLQQQRRINEVNLIKELIPSIFLITVYHKTVKIS